MASLQTGLTPEDRIENEVRKRLAERLASAGVNQGRISLEVLYWLPADFVRLYMQVTEMALRIDDSLGSAMGGSAGDEGKASISKVGGGPTRGKTAGGLHTRTSGAHARGGKGGGRYMRHWLVKNDDMMKLKSGIDRRIRRAIEEAIREHRDMIDARRSQGEGLKPEVLNPGGGAERRGERKAERTQGVNPGGNGVKGEGETVEKIYGEMLGELGRRKDENGRCEGCGKFLKKEWVLCPHEHREK